MLQSLKGLRKPVTMLSLVASLGLLATASQAKAATFNLNLDTYFTGDTLGSAGVPMENATLTQSTPTFTDSNGNVHVQGSTVGSIGNCVFEVTSGSFDVGDYVYEERLSPSTGIGLDNILTSFTADFDVVGFTGEAGYSYSQVPGTGNSYNTSATESSAFTGSLTGTNHINWNNASTSDTFDGGTSLTFFFVSTDAPSLSGLYEAQDDIQATATSYAPTIAVPVPAAASMGLIVMAGLAGVGVLRRRTASV